MQVQLSPAIHPSGSPSPCHAGVKNGTACIPLISALLFAGLPCTASPQLPVGAKAPPFSIKIVKGDTVRYFGPNSEKPLAVLFFSPSDKESVRGIINFNIFATRFCDDDIDFIAICSAPDKAVEEFLNEWGKNLSVDIYNDKDNTLVRAYKLTTVPYAYFINKKGSISWFGHPMAFSEHGICRLLETGDMPAFEFTVEPVKSKNGRYIDNPKKNGGLTVTNIIQMFSTQI